MTNNHFEKRIQEKLNQFEIEPSENLFNHILEKRASRSKSFFKFSYAKVGVAILAAVAITVLVVVNQSPVNAPRVANTIVSAENHASDNASQAESSKVSASKSAETPKSNSNKVQDLVVGKEKSNLYSASTKSKGSKVKSGTKGKANSEIKLAANKKVENNEKSQLVVSNSPKNKRYGLKTYNGYSDNGVNIAERYFNVDAKDRPILASQQHNGKSHLYVYHSVDEALVSAKDLSYLVLKPLSLASPKAERDQLAALEQKKIETKIKTQHPIFIDLYYTALLTSHQVSGNSSLESNYQTLSKRNANQALNLRVSKPISSRFNVFVGIGMNQLNTKFQGSIPNSTNKVHYETSTYFINDPITGLPTPVQHTDTILNGPVAYQFTNSYKLMQIPIGLSYNMGFKRFDLAIHGAGLMNITTLARGTNPNFDLEKMSSFNSNKKHLGLGASISLMVAYKITNRIRIIAEPGVQYFKLNARKNGNAVNENIFNSGVSIGLRYTLF